MPARSPIPLIVSSSWRAPALNRRQGIGDAHAQIVVAVRAQRDAFRAVQGLDHAAEHGRVFLGYGVADSVRQIDDGRARLHGGADGLAQEIDVGAAGVFGGKFNFRAALARIAHVRGDGFERLLARHAQLVVQVQVRRRQKRVQARMLRFREAFEGHVDVLLSGAGQRRHGAGADFAGHRLHAFQVSRGGDREAALNDVHAKRFDLPGQADFLRHGHGKSRGLLPVPQRRIKNAYDVHVSALSCNDLFHPIRASRSNL